MTQHAIRRTSPKGLGQTFIGTCSKCGQEGLTLEDMDRDDCPNVRGISDEDALLEILENPVSDVPEVHE